MKISIHQPGYHRHIKYYCKMLLSDIFIVLDNVQYVEREWQNRQRIFYGGKYHWLSVPVNNGREEIRKKLIVNQSVLADHWNTIKWVYSNSPYFHRYSDQFEEIYARYWEHLSELNLAIDRVIINALEIPTKIINASDLIDQEQKTLKKADLILDLIERVAPPEKSKEEIIYLSGAYPEPVDYYLNSTYSPSTITEKQKLLNKGIAVARYMFTERPYPQYQTDEFIPSLPAIDLLFNLGPDAKNEVRSYVENQTYV